MCAENPQLQLHALPTRRDALVSNFTRVSVILLRACKGDHYPSGLEALVVYQPIMDFS